MQQNPSASHSIIIAGTVCFILVVALVGLWFTVDIPRAYLQELFLLSVLFGIALVTVVVYQSLRISESASVLAQNLTEDMLLYSHDLFTELYRSSPVPYLVITEDGSIESTNTATVRLFNCEIGSLDALNVFSFIEGDEQHHVDLIPEYFKQGKSVNDVEVMIRRPDNTTKWVILSLFSFTDSKRVHKGLLTLVDITKQKMIDKAKTEFVSLASHQLRTPISGMKWNIELLQTAGAEHLTDLQKGYIEKIQHSVERMDILVSDFLNVSKFELGTLTPTYAPVVLGDFLASIYEEHSIFAEKKEVRIEKNWATDIGTINSDSHLLHMIVSNLVSNAVKYTGEKGTVRFEAAMDTAHVTITVGDTGMGIPIDEQDMVFSKLFRATNAKSSVTSGTGLGLYIVKEAVLVLGGSINFESKEGVGTTFTVILPVG